MGKVELREEGKRVYVVGDTYPIRETLKEIGCRWDPEKRAWWIGLSGKAGLEKVIAQISGNGNGNGNEEQEVPSHQEVIGKVKVDGRTYYVIWEGFCKDGVRRVKTCSLDGKYVKWFDWGEVANQYVRYQVPQTLRGIRKFIEKSQEEERKEKERNKKREALFGGNPTASIPVALPEDYMREFFGDQMLFYEYYVTQEEAEDFGDGRGGWKRGWEVPVDLAKLWDEGLRRCREAGIKKNSREGLLLRLSVMKGQEVTELPAALEKYLES